MSSLSKAKKHSVKLTLPAIFMAGDYHEFTYVENILKSLNRKLRCKEVAVGDLMSGYYVGIIYAGRKPKQSEVLALLESQKKASTP